MSSLGEGPSRIGAKAAEELATAVRVVAMHLVAPLPVKAPAETAAPTGSMP